MNFRRDSCPEGWERRLPLGAQASCLHGEVKLNRHRNWQSRFAPAALIAGRMPALPGQDACAPKSRCLRFQVKASSSRAEALDCVPQDVRAGLEFGSGNKLARAMRDANVARTKHDCFGAEFGHLRRFSSEGDCARFVAG